MEAIRDKWIKWIEVIKNEAIVLCDYHSIYFQLKEIRKANPALHEDRQRMFAFIFNSYAAYAVMTVRRLIKSHRSSISLRQLLEEIKDHPEVISREYFQSLSTEEGFDADTQFTKLAGKEDQINPTDVYNDICKLEKVTTTIEAHADSYVAHIGRRQPNDKAKWQDIDSSVRTIEEIIMKYHFLLTGIQMVSLTPNPESDISRVLNEAWCSE